MSFVDASQFWKNRLQTSLKSVEHAQLENVSGRIIKVTGLVMEAVGIKPLLVAPASSNFPAV